MSRFYATTPIFYVNDAPHVGHAYNAVSTDAVVRWHRLLGDDVHFLTGTDEHGLKVQRSAEVSYDDYIRTTEPRHHHAVKALLQAAYDNGYITKGTYEGAYCVSCEAYYTDEELIVVDGEGDDEPVCCPIHKRPIEHMVEDNYFFKLSAFEQPLLDWFELTPDNITPDGFRNEALGLLKLGLRDVSMTRSSIDWGISVPWDDDHVFYVWYDALINYATAVGYGADDDLFSTWWPATHHFIGKDILRFHCIYWPAMLMAAGIDPMPHFHVHGFLLLGGEKMSKSGNVTRSDPTANSVTSLC